MLNKFIAAVLAIACCLAASSVLAAVDPKEIMMTHKNPVIRRLAKEKVESALHLRTNPRTIPALNVSAYLGTWYNVYANLFVLETFSNHSQCATATYGPSVQPVNGVNRVGVLNWERQYSTTGPVRSIRGFAEQRSPSTEPGVLGVCLDTRNSHQCDADKNPLFLAPYWIFDISPMVNGQYQWAIVSDNLRLTLFVLARDLGTWTSRYEKEVLELAAKRGFTGLDAPIKIPQGPSCNYPKH